MDAINKGLRDLNQFLPEELQFSLDSGYNETDLHEAVNLNSFIIQGENSNLLYDDRLYNSKNRQRIISEGNRNSYNGYNIDRMGNGVRNFSFDNKKLNLNSGTKNPKNVEVNTKSPETMPTPCANKDED